MHGWAARNAARYPQKPPAAIIARLDESITLSIHFFIYVFSRMEVKLCKPFHAAKEPVIIYADAQWEPIKRALSDDPEVPLFQTHTTGLGALLFLDGARRSAAGEPPREVIEALFPRKTQIIVLELLAAIAVLATFADILLGRDIVWFIDNQPVCAALCKGASHSGDIQTFVTAFHTTCLQLGIRVWIQWVPSDANPSDEPSRSGTCKYCSQVERLRLPGWSRRDRYPSILHIIDKLLQIPSFLCGHVRAAAELSCSCPPL